MTKQVSDDKLLDEATEWFVRMRADDIAPRRSADFVQWISQSRHHQAAFAEIGGFWDNLPDVEQEPASITSLADHRIAKAAQQNIPARKIWSPGRIAAAIAVFVFTIAGWRYGDVFLMENHSTQVGELADVILDDGSHLELNTNSKIRVDMREDKRIVYLEQGEVFFEVARDESRPFLVETSGGLVRVLGTRFNIRQRGNSSDVTVLEGSVAVKDYGRLDEGMMAPDATLTPDQKFTLGDDAVANVVFPVDSAAVLAWRDRRLIYNGESFRTLVEDINRYFDAEIRIGDPALNDIEVVAILKVENQAATLKALEATFNVTARPLSRKLIYLYPNK